MTSVLAFGMVLAASSLVTAPVNDNGTTGECLVHGGSPHGLQTLDLEFDPSDAHLTGVLPETGWVNALGFEMRGRNSTFDFATSTNAGSMWCIAGSPERFADIRLDLPQNARITFFRMWGADTSPDNDIAAFLFSSCLPNFSSGDPLNTELARLESSDAPGSFSIVAALPAPQPVTDTRNCTYWARARYATSCQGGIDLILRKFRIQYALVP